MQELPGEYQDSQCLTVKLNRESFSLAIKNKLLPNMPHSWKLEHFRQIEKLGLDPVCPTLKWPLCLFPRRHT